MTDKLKAAGFVESQTVAPIEMTVLEFYTRCELNSLDISGRDVRIIGLQRLEEHMFAIVAFYDRETGLAYFKKGLK